MTATVITYRDGQIVQEPADEHFARIERERTDARHVANILGLAAKSDRDGYLWSLAQREGPEAAERVRLAGKAAWEARRSRGGQ